LKPEDIKILSLGAIWNFDTGTGLSWADIRLWGTKGPSTRPRCIRTVRARTQCKSINHVIFNGHFSDNNEEDLWVHNLMCAMWAHAAVRMLGSIIFMTMIQHRATQMFGRSMQLKMLYTKDLILYCTLYYFHYVHNMFPSSRRCFLFFSDFI